MTQKSYFWPDNTIGDAQAYSFDEWTDLWGLFFTTDRTIEGPLYNIDPNERLAASISIAAPNVELFVDAGVGIVDGKLYINDAQIAFTPFAFAGGVDGRIILRNTTATGTVRAVVVSPLVALVQTAAVWEIELAEFAVNGAGAITIFDETQYTIAQSPLMPPRVGSGTIDLLDTVIGNGALTAMTFNPIVQTYDHLYIIGVGNTTTGGASSTEGLRLTFNNDAGANYSDNQVMIAAPSWQEVQSGNAHDVGRIGRDQAQRFTSFQAWIPYYRDTNYKQPGLWKTFVTTNAAPAGNNYEITFGGGIWDNTNAITRIDIFSQPVSPFRAGTKYLLYGIKS